MDYLLTSDPSGSWLLAVAPLPDCCCYLLLLLPEASCSWTSGVRMKCQETLVSSLSWSMLLMAVAYLWSQRRAKAAYGRYGKPVSRCCPAQLGWCLQELPSFLVPLLLLLPLLVSGADGADGPDGSHRMLLLGTFMLHYFHR